jgi:hypothetical protein
MHENLMKVRRRHVRSDSDQGLPTVPQSRLLFGLVW